MRSTFAKSNYLRQLTSPNVLRNKKFTLVNLLRLSADERWPGSIKVGRLHKAQFM